MSNPPAINFSIPFAPIAFHVIVNANGVQADGTNVPVPDLTSPLVITGVSGPTAYSAAVDPSDNRRVIVTPQQVPIGGGPIPFTFRVSVAGRSATVTVGGSTPPAAEMSGVSWDGVAPAPA